MRRYGVILRPTKAWFHPFKRLVERSPDDTGLVIERDKEWWGDQGDANDILRVNGTNIVNETTAPHDEWMIAMIVFDAGSDGESDVTTPIETLNFLPLIRGIDLFLPGDEPPTETVAVETDPRGADFQREIAVPNWASENYRVTVSLPDHTRQR